MDNKKIKHKTGPKKKDKKDINSCRLVIMVPPDIKEKFDKITESLNLNESTLARTILTGYIQVWDSLDEK